MYLHVSIDLTTLYIDNIHTFFGKNKLVVRTLETDGKANLWQNQYHIVIRGGFRGGRARRAPP